MVDLSNKGSESEEMCSKTPTSDQLLSDGSSVKTCVDCGTSKTPLWRGGPAGPKSLCNACGIRSRKKRRALLGVSKEEKKMKNGSSCTSSSGDSTRMIGGSLKERILRAFGRDIALHKPRSNTHQRKKVGEVEQAAFLLMTLSCGGSSVYA